MTAFDKLLADIDRFALRTKATPVATGQAIAQMVRVMRPHIEAEAAAQSAWGEVNVSLDRAEAVLADTASAAQARVKEIKEAAERDAQREVQTLRKALDRVVNEADDFLAGKTKGLTLTLYIGQARALLGERERGGDGN